MRKELVECFERNINILLNQRESKEDREITVLILEECLERVQIEKIDAATKNDYETYFRINNMLKRAIKKIEKRYALENLETSVIEIYRKINCLLNMD